MSVAKTPAQQEANFANIRIIKARFAKDGQTFEDCVFNNDTMKIIIDDARYRYTKTYKNLKHHDEEDVERLEKKAESLSKIHVTLSQHAEGEILGRVNDVSINDLLEKNKQPESPPEISPNTDFHPETENHEKETLKAAGIENIHISTTRTDISPDENRKLIEFIADTVKENESEGATEGAIEGTNNAGLLELDEDADIETLDDTVSDAVNDAVSDAVKPDLLDWSGETFTNIEESPPEVKIEDIPPLVEKKSIDLTQFKPPAVTVQEPPPEAKEVKSHANDMDDIMKMIKETDPDEERGEHRTVHDMLVKKRDYQNVKKNE